MFVAPRVRITRPANTTQYTAGDAVFNTTVAADNRLEFSLGQSRGRRSGRVVGGHMAKSSNVATVATFALHLFDRIKVASQGDNGAAVHFTDNVGYIGKLVFDLTTGTDAVYNGPIGIQATALTQTLAFQRVEQGAVWGYLVVTGAYQPTSAETYDLRVDIEV